MARVENPCPFMLFLLVKMHSTLRRMANIALNLQNNAPRLAPTTVPSSFSTAIDTVSIHVSGYNQANPSKVRLTETFLGIVEPLKKPRGSLMN